MLMPRISTWGSSHLPERKARMDPMPRIVNKKVGVWEQSEDSGKGMFRGR